ncbi:hypothetical protein CNMCM6106_005858 [Aspergillus hiratsukae]|uniref:Uncharacterized protein n=1 Tax=Aspergillus hiratsukae TaxID=1194566 RepID=A0A8H6QGC6_9EURO|nr:hypothetical protein CNMCM6106_005858 [Aspergillus hiratsukae]
MGMDGYLVATWAAHRYTEPTTKESVSLPNDYEMLSDLFGTGWAALEFASLRPGDTAAVHGAGPREDYVPERLRLAESIGAIPINCRDADRVDRIRALQHNSVAPSVDAVGYEQVNRQSNNTATAPRAASVHTAEGPSRGLLLQGVPVGCWAFQAHRSRTGGGAEARRPGFVVSDAINIKDAPNAFRSG